MTRGTRVLVSDREGGTAMKYTSSYMPAAKSKLFVYISCDILVRNKEL